MRASWWAYIPVVLLICAVALQHFNQPPLSTGLGGPSEQSERHPLEQNPELPLTNKDEGRSVEGRVQEIDSAPTAFEPEPLPNPQKEAPQEEATSTVTVESSEPNDTKQITDNDEGRLIEGRVQEIDSAPTAFESEPPPNPQKEAPQEDATGTVTAAHSEPNDTKQNLSYLAYYAYSELPPETKPADTVLDSLKGIPPGKPVDEIKRVSDLLGLDFTFMKTVAKIESGFDPKQRTGSYIGLFQLSRSEFKKYGTGDILAARDNVVAAALKFMTEAVLFEMFTHRKPTLNDLYLIHQQGVDGAAEHVSHPHRLAWRSMCATDEGKEKGERWCKRAIWGNTLPAVKRAWKNVNNVSSGAFVAMWQQRVAHFYARYSEAASN